MNFLEKRKAKIQRSMRRLPEKLRTAHAQLRRVIRGGTDQCMAFYIAGGIGDHLLAARFVRDFGEAVPSVPFDIICTKPGIARWIFEAIPGCRDVLDRKGRLSVGASNYLCEVQAFTYARTLSRQESLTSSSHPRLHGLLESIDVAAVPIRRFIEASPQLDGYLGTYAAKCGMKRHNHLHAMAGLTYGGDALTLAMDDQVLGEHGLSAGHYVTISNGYDEEAVGHGSGHVTKVFPYFSELIQQVKAHRPDLKIVQIGTETSSPLAEVDVNLISRTSLKEAAALLHHAAMHLDIEGGLVHLATSLGTPCGVIFGPTLADYFGYESNLNFAPAECGGCWWMESTWMTRCIRGDIKPRCMESHRMSHVVEQINDRLDRRSPARSAQCAA